MTRRVLCIDDDSDILELLHRTLSTSGQWDVRTASSALMGLDMLDEWTPDLVLLDFSMPEIDGRQTLARIRARLPVAPPSVVFLSAMVGTQMLAEYRAWGAQGAISKPVYVDDIQSQIETILRA